MVAGLKDAFAPAGSPVALRVMFCAAPLVSVVVMELVPLCPAVTVTAFGFAAMEKSFGGGGGGVLDALNVAMPAAQYIAEPNPAVKVCAADDVSAW